MYTAATLISRSAATWVGDCASNRGPPECFPSARLEFHPDHLQHAPRQTCGRLGVGLDTRFRRVGGLADLGHLALCGAAAPGLGLAALTAEVVSDLVPRDRGQPPAETVLGPIAAKAGQMEQDRREHFLKRVRRIFGGQARSTAPTIDDRTIEPHESLPCLRPGSPKLVQERRGDRDSSWKERPRLCPSYHLRVGAAKQPEDDHALPIISPERYRGNERQGHSIFKPRAPP